MYDHWIEWLADGDVDAQLNASGYRTTRTRRLAPGFKLKPEEQGGYQELVNFAARIGERIEWVVIAQTERYQDGDYVPIIDPRMVNTPLSDMHQVALALEPVENLVTGFGHSDTPAIYAWTRNWIILSTEYDGSTGLKAMPRHPIACKPTFA